MGPIADASPIADAVTEDTSDLGRRMAKGAAWAIAMRFVIRGIGLASMVILARLLVPADFGLVALATMIYGLLEIMGQFSFDVVLIQNQNADRAHYDTAWTLTVLRNLVVALLLFIGAPWIAGFFSDSRLIEILYWLALAAFIEGFANIGVVNFRKELRFNKDFIFMVGAKIGTFAVAIPLAFIWRDYRALVAGIVTAALLRFILSYLMQPYRPGLCLAKWREMMRFSKWLVINNIIYFMFSRADALVIGKISGPQLLGIYTVGHEISNLPTTELIAPIRRAIYPGYARLSHRPEELKKNFIETLAIIIMLGVPSAAGVGLIADPLIRTFLGEQWVSSIPLVQILALHGFFAVCSANIWPVFMSLKKPELFTVVIGVGLAVIIPLLLWGTIIAGPYGAAWAVTAASAAISLLSAKLVIRLLNLSVSQIILEIWRTGAATIVMIGCTISLVMAWPEPQTTTENGILLIFCVLMGAGAYIGSHLFLWRLSGMPHGPEQTTLEAFRRVPLRIRRRFTRR